jgi:hypothetical protein
LNSKSGKSWFLGGQMTCGDDKVFGVGSNAKKVASRALGGIFSGGWTRKMEIPAEVYEQKSPGARIPGLRYLFIRGSAKQHPRGHSRFQ